jgi:hypothetical protein
MVERSVWMISHGMTLIRTSFRNVELAVRRRLIESGPPYAIVGEVADKPRRSRQTVDFYDCEARPPSHRTGTRGPFSGGKTAFVTCVALGPAACVCRWHLRFLFRRPCLITFFIFTGSYTEPDESTARFTSFNSILVFCGLSVLFPKQVCMHLPFPCMLHIPPISTSGFKELMNFPHPPVSFSFCQIFP